MSKTCWALLEKQEQTQAKFSSGIPQTNTQVLANQLRADIEYSLEDLPRVMDKDR